MLKLLKLWVLYYGKSGKYLCFDDHMILTSSEDDHQKTTYFLNSISEQYNCDIASSKAIEVQFKVFLHYFMLVKHG